MVLSLFAATPSTTGQGMGMRIEAHERIFKCERDGSVLARGVRARPVVGDQVNTICKCVVGAVFGRRQVFRRQLTV
jgi:hypothetical protein